MDEKNEYLMVWLKYGLVSLKIYLFFWVICEEYYGFVKYMIEMIDGINVNRDWLINYVVVVG